MGRRQADRAEEIQPEAKEGVTAEPRPSTQPPSLCIQATAEVANFAEVGGGVGTASASVNGILTISEPGSLALLGVATLVVARRR